MDDDLAADLAAIDQSFGALPDLEFPDRSHGEREAHLERLWGDE